MKETSVTIISTNLNKKILDNYSSYHVIDDNFTLEELLNYPKIIFFNVLNNLKESKVKEIFNFLSSHNISFINVTNNTELALFTNYLIIYDESKILIEGKTIEVFKNEKLLKRIGIKLPFMIELSLLLQDYNLTNKIYENFEDCRGELWP